jgi:hypothetical protein
VPAIRRPFDYARWISGLREILGYDLENGTYDLKVVR